MATVYRAHDTALNRAVAIKVLDPALAMDPRAVERFRREAVTAANLEHPSIVRVYDVEQAGTLHYIAMRYVQGTTLRDILRDNGPLALESIVSIIKPIASALHYAHRHGVIHRDVKPGNILVEPDGSVLLTDFGIARAADNAQSALTATGHVMGTADYLAPEQISGRPAEARSDVYSLGVVLYEMLTGVTPFAGEHTATVLYRQVHDNPPPLRSVNPRLPAELQPVADKALAKNPSLRYADPLDLARDLEEVARWLPPGSPWLNRRPGSGSPNVLGNGAGPRRLTGPLGPGTGGHTQPPRNRPSTRPYEKPRPYSSEQYEYTPPVQPEREVITPLPVGRRGTIVLAGALLLLAAGALLIAFATGVFGRGGSPGAARFQEPGERTYSGPVRENNGPDIRIPLALVPPTMDGNLADWAGAAPGPFPATNVTYEQGRQWAGPDDLGAEFKFAWDSSNFYVAVVVTDNVHVQTTRTRGTDLYKGDDVELWFDTDLAGDFASREGNADDFQLGLSPGDFEGLAPEAYFWNPDRKPERIRLVTVAARPREGGNGYTLEAVMPWQALGNFRPQPGGAIGFAASAGDNDQPEVPIQELMISTAPELKYKQPLTFGNLFF
jgi:serine/threonine protein kinase